MLIPYTKLSKAAFEALLDDYATRDGTDDGQFTTLEDRKAELLKVLKSEQVFITFNADHMQACLVLRHEVPAQALREYQELKRSLEAEAETADTDTDESINDEPIKAQIDSSSAEPLVIEPELLKAKVGETHADKIAAHLARMSVPFNPGRTVMTRSVNVMLEEGTVALLELQELLHKHCSGEFGVIPDVDKLTNFEALPAKEYLRSKYELAGKYFVVITDHGHALTTVMLEGDY